MLKARRPCASARRLHLIRDRERAVLQQSSLRSVAESRSSGRSEKVPMTNKRPFRISGGLLIAPNPRPSTTRSSATRLRRVAKSRSPGRSEKLSMTNKRPFRISGSYPSGSEADMYSPTVRASKQTSKQASKHARKIASYLRPIVWAWSPNALTPLFKKPT